MAQRSDVLIPDVVPPKTIQLAPKQTRSDGWANAVSGLGTRRDKRVYNSFNSHFLTKEDCISMYSGDGLVARIIDSIPDDMTREWGHFQNDPKDVFDEGLLAHEMRRLHAPQVFNQAAKWARLTGGALVAMTIIDGRTPDQSVNMTGIKNIESLRAYDLGAIKTSECTFDTNPRSPTFGKILVYKIVARAGHSLVEYNIHHTRCIPIFGVPTPPSFKEGGNMLESIYWGTPLMQKVYQDLRDFRGAFASTNNILQEFIIGKYKFSDLDEMLATGNGGALMNRIQGIEMTKSSIQAVMLGIDEEYTRDAATVTGIPDVLDRFMMLLSASTGIPVTKLFGRSASGLNATGEGDSKNYYDQIHVAQNDLTPYLEMFGTLLASWKKLSIVDMSWKWCPLAQLTEEQEANVKRIDAETFRTYADANQRYIDAGVVMPEEVRAIAYPELPEIEMPDEDELGETAEDPMAPDDEKSAESEDDPEEDTPEAEGD